MINFFLVLAIKWLLDLVFWLYVEPIFGADPYLAEYGGFDFGKWLIASALAPLLWAFARCLKTTSARISSFYIQIQFFIIVLPYLVLFGMQDRPYYHIIILCGAFSLLVFLIALTPRIIVPSPPKIVAYALAAVGVACCAYVYLGLMATGGLARLNFNLYSVYETRGEYEHAMLPGFGYFVSWVAYVINMALLVYFLIKRRWVLVGGVLAAQLLLFGMTNFKSFLFAPIIALGLGIARQRFSLERLLLVGSITVTVAGVLIYNAGELMGVSILRRALFVPAALHGLYFDYFSEAPISMLSGTRFASLFGATYDETTVSMIARLFWGQDMSPNVGWVGDAFAQFRWSGVVVYTFVLAALLKVADCVVAELDPNHKAIEGLLVGSAFALCSSSLTAVFLTHGFFVLLVTLWVLSHFLRAVQRH